MQRLLEYCARHPLLALVALAAALAVLVYEWRERARSVGAVSPQDAVRLMNQGATIIDVRSAEAFGEGHIRGARNLPAEQWAAGVTGPSGIDSLKRHKDKPLIVYCERDVTAGRVIRQLTEQGFSRVVNLRGGLSAWRAEHLPLARLSVTHE